MHCKNHKASVIVVLSCLAFCLSAKAQTISWELLDPQQGGTILHLMPTPDDGIIAGQQLDTKFRGLRSWDGGATWTPLQASGVPVLLGEDGTIIAVNSAEGILYLSVDGGSSFRQLNIAAPVGTFNVAAQSPGGSLLVAGNQGVLRSTDKGLSWSLVLSNSIGNACRVYGGSDDAVYAFVAGAGLSRSDDDGLDWQSIDPGYGVQQLLIRAGGSLLAGTLNGGILRSDDRGASWSSFALAQKSIAKLAVNQQGVIFALLENKEVFRILNNGSGAEELTIPAGIPLSLSVAADNTLLLGYRHAGLLQSQDKGESWQRIGLPVEEEITDLSILPDDNFILSLATAGIAISADEGSSWSYFGRPPLADDGMRGFVLSPDQAAWFAYGQALDGRSMAILSSTDGGDWWPLYEPPDEETRILGILGHNHRSLLIAESSGLAYYRGSWCRAPELEGHQVLALQRGPDVSAYALTQSGLLFHTENACGSWTERRLYDEAVSERNTLAVTVDGDIFVGHVDQQRDDNLMHSGDGGQTWQILNPGANKLLPWAMTTSDDGSMTLAANSGIYVYHKANGWRKIADAPGNEAIERIVVNRRGSILALEDGRRNLYRRRIPTSVDRDFREAPSSVVLSVHPTPVTVGVAQIEFYLTAATEARLTIHDTFGRLVRTLRQGHFAPGSHRITWATDRLNAGVYIVSLHSAELQPAARVVVVR